MPVIKQTPGENTYTRGKASCRESWSGRKGILAHGSHVVVRLSPEHVDRIQPGAMDERYIYGILTAPPSHPITRAWYSSVAEFSNKLSQISESSVGVATFARGHSLAVVASVYGFGKPSVGAAVRKTKPPVPSTSKRSLV